jgi:hypothetical protein
VRQPPAADTIESVVVRDPEPVAASAKRSKRLVDRDTRAEDTLVRVGDLGQALPIASGPSGGDGASADPAADGGAALHADSGSLPLPAGTTGIAALLLLSATSIAATLARRRLARRQVRAAVVARLATLRDREPALP